MEITFNAAYNPVIRFGNLRNDTDITDVNDGINHVFASLSTASFVVLTILLLIHSRKNEDFSCIPYSNGVLFFCSLVTMVAESSMSKETFYYSYSLTIIMLIGILVNIIGSRIFFKTPTEEERSLGDVNHASIGILIWGITLPLALMEMMMAFCMLRKRKFLFAITIIATIFQKIIQVTTFYFGIRHKVPVVNKHGASLFLKVIAIYNLAMWLQSIVDGNNTMQEYLSDILDGASDVVGSVYAALTTDYRLLCSLLFAEIAIEVDGWNEDSSHSENSRYRSLTLETNMFDFRIRASEYTGLGYVVGLVLLGTQFLNALQFLRRNPVTPMVNLFGMVAEVAVIIQGIVLLLMGRTQNEEKTEKEVTSKGVDIMVGLMGIVGLAFWILKCSLVFFLLSRLSPLTEQSIINHLLWNNAKFGVRIVGLPFQLYFFCRITNSFSCREIIRNKKTSYFVLPCLMLSQLSVFVNAAIDSYSYIIEEYMEKLELNKSMLSLYRIGEPLYLGFCLHVFFRFLIINNRLRLIALQRQAPNFNNLCDEDIIAEEQVENLLDGSMIFRTA